MSKIHYEYMPNEKDCGYCSRFRMNDSKGIKCYCVEHKGYYQINDRCNKQQYVNRDEKDIEKFLRWWVSSMIGVSLEKDITKKPFTSIKKLRDYLESNVELKKYTYLYDIYGTWISECLKKDVNKEFIESLMPILNKVAYLVDKDQMLEAFNEYYKMIMLLYKRYIYTFNYNNDTKLVKSK